MARSRQVNVQPSRAPSLPAGGTREGAEGGHSLPGNCAHLGSWATGCLVLILPLADPRTLSKRSLSAYARLCLGMGAPASVSQRRAGGGRARPWGVHTALAREGHGTSSPVTVLSRRAAHTPLLPPDSFAGPQLPEAVLSDIFPVCRTEARWPPPSPLETSTWAVPDLAARADSWCSTPAPRKLPLKEDRGVPQLWPHRSGRPGPKSSSRQSYKAPLA